MPRSRLSTALIALLVSCPALAAELLSVPATTAVLPANGASSAPMVSDDNRWVVFASAANNLVAADPNGFRDIFLHDRANGTNTLVSAASQPANGHASTYAYDVSNDGRYVVFASAASNLVAGDDNDRPDLFRKDLSNGSIQRISSLLPTEIPQVSLTGDGRYAYLLDEGDRWVAGASANRQVLRIDWQTLQVHVIITDRAPQSGPLVSSDGRCIAFGGSDPVQRVRVRNLVNAQERWVDSTPQGASPNGASPLYAIDANCEHVAFSSFATDLLASGNPDTVQVYRRHLASDALQRVSISPPGSDSDEGIQLWMSADARFIAYDRARYNVEPALQDYWFELRDMLQAQSQRAEGWLDPPAWVLTSGTVLTHGPSAVPGDLNGLYDIHVAPSPVGQPLPLVQAVSQIPVPAADGASTFSTASRVESGDGRWVAFDSLATNLLPALPLLDTRAEIFLRDRSLGTTERALAAFGLAPNGDSNGLDLSHDARFLLFWSCASNLVAGDSNGQCDVFLLDRVGLTIERINLAPDGAQADFEQPYAYPAQVSNDGRFVVFISSASNLDAGNDSPLQTYVRDRQSGTTRLLMRDAGAAPLDGYSHLIDLANDGRYATLWNGSSNAQPDCFVVGVDLVSGARDCPATDVDGSPIGNPGLVSLSADGRFAVYRHAVEGTAIARLKDRSSGRVRLVDLSSGGLDALDGVLLSGNGRYLAVYSANAGGQRAGVYDLILGAWVAAPSFDIYEAASVLNHAGTALVQSSMRVLDAADGNGAIPDVYRHELRGEGVFGGVWQGGFE